MADSLKNYIGAIEATLQAALCLRNFPSQVVERHNKPEVEANMSKELILNPIVIARDTTQQCLIEPSINSIRVSIRIKQNDSLESVLVDKFTRALALRADDFIVLRRKPVEGYNISFLITNFHLELMKKDELVAFIIHFMKEIDAEIATMKLNVNARAAVVANVYLQQFF
eukprot:TRINITY_DN48610_c0_g1_i1.p2 TRINITY_DN48610_c0_g1~~TRINITY_DN48610_c0_g1_i1.p2  ORF type:complete len:177 (+),score=44.40 TRINITY_DN48610_c0_g1_i1:23-532(+)